jgi:hypothetical protein
MATNSYLALACLCLCAAAGAREAASPSTCQTAGTQPPISSAKATMDQSPTDLQPRFALADAWSDAGCFSDAVQVLQAAQASHSGNKELQTRLRVAKSLVGEEHFFDNIDRANADAKLKRQTFRCSTLADLDACTEALNLKPDDPALLVAQGDAFLHAKRPADAIGRYRLAAVLAPNQHDVSAKISAAEAQLPSGPQHAAAPGNTPAARAGNTPAPGNSTQVSRGAAQAAGNAAARKPPPTLQVASTASNEPAPRRYSNAAPETRSH